MYHIHIPSKHLFFVVILDCGNLFSKHVPDMRDQLPPTQPPTHNNIVMCRHGNLTQWWFLDRQGYKSIPCNGFRICFWPWILNTLDVLYQHHLHCTCCIYDHHEYWILLCRSVQESADTMCNSPHIIATLYMCVIHN